MLKRLTDVVLAGTALVVLSPVLLASALAVRLTSAGPVLFRAPRTGRGEREFRMLKFRTMHVDQRQFRSAITAHGDPRIFPVGRLLRQLKLDELPQLLNVLRGEMSIVGPRPEDPGIVREHYRPGYRETLRVRPGLASPGSIFNYTHGETLIGTEDPERDYVERLLPYKLALDTVYVRHASLAYDVRVIGRTLLVIASLALGRRGFQLPPESGEAERILAEWGMAGPGSGAPGPDASLCSA